MIETMIGQILAIFAGLGVAWLLWGRKKFKFTDMFKPASKSKWNEYK